MANWRSGAGHFYFLLISPLAYHGCYPPAVHFIRGVRGRVDIPFLPAAAIECQMHSPHRSSPCCCQPGTQLVPRVGTLPCSIYAPCRAACQDRVSRSVQMDCCKWVSARCFGGLLNGLLDGLPRGEGANAGAKVSFKALSTLAYIFQKPRHVRLPNVSPDPVKTLFA